MKGQGKWKKTKKKDNGKLQKYMVSVDEFVQSKSGCGEEENGHDRLRFVKKKSRKELRKEKRKIKKAKMKSYYEGKKDLSLPLDDGEDSGITSPTEKPHNNKKVKEKANKEMSKSHQSKSAADKSKTNSKMAPVSKKGKKVSKLRETRKKALLEANEAEDREIKKLERYLGLNKRKNKNLPQSFTADGLDYILGVLDSGSAAVGLYDSDDDMDMAKDNFEKLGKSESQTPGEGEEPEDESADEGSDEDLDSTDEENEVGEDDDDDDEEDEEMVDEEEAEEMEEEEDGLEESDVADSNGESEGEAENETDAPDTKTSGTVSSEI